MKFHSLSDGVVTVLIGRAESRMLVDVDDYARIAGLRLHVWSDKAVTSIRYARVVAPGTDLHLMPVHRLILGLNRGYGVVVDHRDSDGLNNTRSNLRICTQAENLRNSRARKRDLPKGVSRHPKTDKFRARIDVGGRERLLGYFATPEEAHAAYCAAAVKHFGEFANFGAPR